MACNDSNQNSDTEVFLAKTQFECESKDYRYLDCDNDWLSLGVNVQNEIWRGKKLREINPKPDKSENEFVPAINFFESFGNQPRVRKGHLETFKNNTSQSTSRSRCPCARTISADSTNLAINRISKTNTIQTKTTKGKRCPMRIAELAVPTKRQCIETWRNKSDVLPEFMVERLKQHVMDQIPIVKIPEAIYCFQNRRRMESKNCSFRWLSSKHKFNETHRHTYQSHQMDETTLCIIFAHKVAKRLARPINLTLNSNLEKLSTIVSSDISQIMSKCHCTSNKRRQYKAIHTDVSNKITVWITSILEDLSFKLLEEDLRVKCATDAQMKTMLEFSERLVTIIDTMLNQEIRMKSKDLEEEEGPVLEFIDDVVETVMNICEPPQPHIDSDLSGSTKDILLGKESELEEIFNSESSTQVITEKTDDSLIDSNESLMDSEYFLNEISNIIDCIITQESGDDMSNGSGDDIGNGSEEDIENEEVPLKTEMEHNTNDYNNEEILPEAGIEHDINDENFDQIDENSPNVDENDEASDNAAETHSNVSERFEIFTDDSEGDKSSKKVMFPKKDLVNPDKPTEQIKTSNAEEPTPEPNEHKRAPWNPQTNKSNIMFAEPNQNLLSNADESWPAELGDKPMLKVSESASKSVSSLGRITERDEKQMNSPEDEDSMADKGTGDAILQVNDIMDKLDTTLPTEKHDTASQPYEPLIKVNLETSTKEPGETQVDSKILYEKDMSKTITVPKTCEDKPGDESSKLEKYLIDSGESELIRTGSTTFKTEDDKIFSHICQSQVDYGWKVHPKTAPSWVISWGQGRGEPSEDSIPIQLRPTKVSEIELRKWSKELEKAFSNLEMWSNWISATCKESLFILQQKELQCPAFTRKRANHWIRLKRNVYKDALLWTKLYHRTDKKFKGLKKKYNNIEFSSSKVPSVLNRTIFEKMREFEELSAQLHKLIVAAEWCAMCTCNKTKSRYH